MTRGWSALADLFISKGEVIWDGDTIAIVTGDEDIKQQAYLRSAADVGESVFYPSFGSKIFMYLGKPYTRDNKAYIEQAARDALSKVEGIKEILNVEFKEVVNNTEEDRRTDYYIFAEYMTEDGQAVKGDFVYVA